MEQFDLEKIVKPLLGWYDAHARILPWREEPTAYRVWVSEIMLQQTRVEAVRKYYDRWMEQLPTIQDLAEVSEENLMKLWEGLGYYNRARNLKEAAITVMGKFGGQLPGDYEKLLSLKGIGEYTAGAVASIAFGLPEPAVDGNVLRVFSRLLAEEGEIGKQAVKKSLTREVRRILPQERPGDFNQALMDLGATICFPKGQPLCDKCPWEAACQAHKMQRETDFPVKAGKKERRIEKRAVFIIEIHDENGEKRILLHKRPDKGLLSGLWEFPNVEGQYTLEKIREQMKLQQWPDWMIESLEEAGTGKHIFSHIEWQMKGYRFAIRKKQQRNLKEIADMIEKTENEKISGEQQTEKRWIWVTKKQIDEQYALPSAFDCFKKRL